MQQARSFGVIPLVRRLPSDQITPVLAYRRLVASDERLAPSFLFESVEQGARIGRHSFVGAHPVMEVVAHGHDVTVVDHSTGTTRTSTHANPLEVPREITNDWTLPPRPSNGASPFFTGGWVGYAGFDTIRYLEPDSLPFDAAPPDDRGIPDLHLSLYGTLAVFDHVDKILYAVHHVVLDHHDTPDDAWEAGHEALEALVEVLRVGGTSMRSADITLDLASVPTVEMRSNFEPEAFEAAVERCRDYIAAGDVCQVVLSQRFERTTSTDPFDIYRALRIVNPSPYMIYLQGGGTILVAASPEILCRTKNGRVVNRPLAGTRPRGATEEEDLAMAEELLADEKERAEHAMLVDLGRNDLGSICEPSSVHLEEVMAVERYSHVMHLSSTVTGRLRNDVDCWNALQHTLPVGTVSGAPKIRAIQILDELEPTRRGPYGGGIGIVGLDGAMDIAIALRTMVIPATPGDGSTWTVHVQAGAGIVCDSDPVRERHETITKAAALGRAIDLAESTFLENAP